jgi:hypothetical protein
VINALSAAASSIVSTSKRTWLRPTFLMSCCPTHVVTPVASSASLTTNSEAMKMITGSPKPANA